MLPKEIKHRSFQTMMEASPCPSEAKDKYLLELDWLKAVVNLQKYQEETKTWRDPNVKLRVFEVGDLVFLWSPRIESSSKLESKWVGPYAVAEKARLGAHHLLDSQGRMLEHSWNADNLRRSYV
jgi:hypothetical protein